MGPNSTGVSKDWGYLEHPLLLAYKSLCPYKSLWDSITLAHFSTSLVKAGFNSLSGFVRLWRKQHEKALQKQSQTPKNQPKPKLAL